MIREYQKLENSFEKEKKMRVDGEAQLIEAMQNIQASSTQLKELQAAAQPIADMFEPAEEGVEARSLVTILEESPTRLTEYLKTTAKSIAHQVLVFVKSFYPKADLTVVSEGIAGDCSDEQYQVIKEELEPVAELVAQKISFE